MKRILPVIITAISVSGCTFEPVLTAAKRNEVIISPIGFIMLIGILIFFASRQLKPKKKFRHVKKCP